MTRACGLGSNGDYDNGSHYSVMRCKPRDGRWLTAVSSTDWPAVRRTNCATGEQISALAPRRCHASGSDWPSASAEGCPVVGCLSAGGDSCSSGSSNRPGGGNQFL